MNDCVPEPWVRVVIVNYNAGDLLAATIDGLARQTMVDFEVVIVDNASSDDSASLRLPDGRFRILSAGDNLGFAAGCNFGAKGALTPWLAMLNPDAIPQPGWLAALRAATLRFPHAAVFGSTQLRANDPSILDGTGDNYSIFGIAWRGGYGAPATMVRRDAEAFSPCAAAALYRRDAFEMARGFADSFFCYLEDVDLGFRLRLAGHRVIQVADARVLHVGSAITGRHSPFTLFYTTRNGVFLMIRCMPLPLLALSLPLYVLAQSWLMLRTPGWAMRMAGLAKALAAIPRLLRERRDIHAARRLSALSITRLLAWHPAHVSRREIMIVSKAQTLVKSGHS